MLNGSVKRKNKYDDDDDNNNSREGMQQGGNRKNIINRERRIVENSSGVDSSSSSSNNVYKNECVDSNPSCLMWACDGECASESDLHVRIVSMRVRRDD